MGPHVHVKIGPGWSLVQLRFLASTEQHVAVVLADDMLAVQELHMAGEVTGAQNPCLTCATAKTVLPIVTSAVAQLRGNPKRAV